MFKGPRPTVRGNTNPIAMTAGGPTVNVIVGGPVPRATRGAVLMAPGSVTHNFDENQRIVPLTASLSGTTLTLSPPANAQKAPPGDYLLYVVSEAGVPSVGVQVRLK